MNWNDELCGVKVTPDGGWVVQDTQTGEWLLCPPSSEGFYLHFSVHQSVPGGAVSLRTYSGHTCTPIFPPRNFAGKFDFELCNEVWPERQDYMVTLAAGEDWRVGFEPADTTPGRISVAAGRIDRCRCGYNDCDPQLDWEPIPDLPALILALQNAQVLARRLA